MENLIIFLVLMTMGYGVGTFAEKRHYKSIRRREKDYLNLPAVTLKTAHYTPDQIASSRLVYGSAVISIDYFKKFWPGCAIFSAEP